MRSRSMITAFVLALAAMGAGAAVAEASSSALTQVRAVYRSVFTAEYFGPASAVCSALTATGVKSFTAGGTGTCQQTFAEEQHVLRHKTKDVDDSGYTAAQWREVVSSVMAHLKVSIHGTRASAIGGESGIPGKTTLVEVSGKWLFNSFPPSIQP